MPEQATRAGGLRLPLFLKLVAGTILVLALVLVPSFLVMRYRIQSEVREAVGDELAVQAQALAGQLAAAPAAEQARLLRELVERSTVRLTVIDPAGVVIGDSEAASASMDNHGDRPEVQAALARGDGRAIRHSATLDRTMIYAARRYPARGRPDGVVRVAVPTDSADAAAARTLDFLDKAAAAAATVSVILSLVVALYLTRGLRRIRRGALALAAGDLSETIGVGSRDEVGEVAAALERLSTQLRGRLLEAGAERATLRALLDELPVGVVVYGRDGAPSALNGAARALLELSPASEVEEARALLAAPEQAPVVARVLEARRSETQTIDVGKGRALQGRWVAVGQEDGHAEPVLILWADAEAERAARPAPEDVRPVALSALCAPVAAHARDRAAPRRVKLEVELAEPNAVVAEVDGRAEAALRRLLDEAVAASEPGAVLRLRSNGTPTDVRISLRVRAGAVKTKWMAKQLAPIGGAAGADRDGEDVELWLSLPRA